MWIVDVINNVFKPNKALQSEEDYEFNQWEYSEGVPMPKEIMENSMPLKELFLNYVERQRSANAAKDAFGVDDPKTKDAYEEANVYKRKVLDAIEEVGNSKDKL